MTVMQICLMDPQCVFALTLFYTLCNMKTKHYLTLKPTQWVPEALLRGTTAETWDSTFTYI